MKRLRFIVIKNAAANVIRGGASSIVAVALPHFLTRVLSVDRFAAWVLMLQIAAYANYLDFGLQTAVARYVAQAIERKDDEERDRIVSTAFFILVAAALLAMIALAIVVWQIPDIFHHAPVALIGELRGGALVLSVCTAALLPLSSFTGVLIGLHRNEHPAIAIGGTRLAGAAGVLVLVHYTHSLVWFALCIGGWNLAGGVLQYLITRRILPSMRVKIALVTRAVLRELARYCAGLTVFSFAMLLVGGVDLLVVGYFDFAATGYYAIAATVISFMTGLSAAAYSALMAPMAVLQERREYQRIRELVLSTSRLGVYGMLAIVAGMAVSGFWLLTVWVGPVYANRALPILIVLLCAQTVRLSCNGYAIALIATGQQRYGIASAMAEGLTNFLASLLGAWKMGAVGVAWGTLFGSVVGVLWTSFYTMPRAIETGVHGRDFAREAILRPLLCFLPVLAWLVMHWRWQLSIRWLWLGIAGTGALLLWAGRLPLASLRLRGLSLPGQPRIGS